MKKNILLCVLLLSSCVPSIKNIDNENFCYPEEKLIEWCNIFKQSNSDYYIYFFNDTCGHCKAIKNDFLTFYFSSELIIYFLQTNEETIYKINYQNLIGTNNIENFFIPGTPCIVHFIDYKVADFIVGIKEITIFINKK